MHSAGKRGFAKIVVDSIPNQYRCVQVIATKNETVSKIYIIELLLERWLTIICFTCQRSFAIKSSMKIVSLLVCPGLSLADGR